MSVRGGARVFAWGGGGGVGDGKMSGWALCQPWKRRLVEGGTPTHFFPTEKCCGKLLYYHGVGVGVLHVSSSLYVTELTRGEKKGQTIGGQLPPPPPPHCHPLMPRLVSVHSPVTPSSLPTPMLSSLTWKPYMKYQNCRHDVTAGGGMTSL